MSKPRAKRPAPGSGRATAVLERLTALSQELAGAYRPATVVEIMARATSESLAPERLSITLLDLDANHLVVSYDSGAEPVPTDDPLLQLALRRGPLVFKRDVAAEAAKLGVTLRNAPASWIGAPIAATGRTMGAVSVSGRRAGAYGSPELEVVKAIAAQAAIALENARLVELLSSGKREWELTVDAITQAICIVDARGAVRRANRVFAGLMQDPITALP